VSRYVTEQLPEAEAEAFEKHYFGCERCWNEVQRATEIRAALAGSAAAPKPSPVPASVVRGPWTNWRFLAAAAAVAGVAIATLLVLRAGKKSGLDALADATGTIRVAEARLSGGFAYGPVQPVTRGGEGDNAPLKVRRVALEAQEAAQNHPSAENIHAAGVAHLLVGEWDEAIAALEKAAQLSPKEAQIWSDLSAAYHTRAIRRGTASDLPSAYAAARRAVDLDGQLTPARFNLALILQSIGHRDEARAAWDAYLKLDSRSGWAAEAKARRQSLLIAPSSTLWNRQRESLLEAAASHDSKKVGAITSRFPQQSRVLLEDQLLTNWAAANDSAEAAIQLRSAREIAEALSQGTGDRLDLDEIIMLERATAPGFDLRAWELLRAGHHNFGQARSRYRDGAIAAALAYFREAETEFVNSHSPYRYLARLGRASCFIYQLNVHAAAPLVADLKTELERSSVGYLAALGHTLWLEGMVRGAGGRLYEGVQSYRESLSQFDLLHESENLAGLQTLLAEALSGLGEKDDAWSHRISALRLLSEEGSSSRLATTLSEASRAALADGYTALALLLSDWNARVADEGTNPVLRADTRLWKAVAEDRAGQQGQAARDLVLARRDCEEIDDVGVQRRARAEIDLVTARILGESLASRASAANRAILFFRSIDDHERLPEVLLARAHLYHDRGFAKLAAADIETAVRELETSRAATQSEVLRLSYFETARDLFDQAIEIVADGNPEDALGIADQAHARTLIDAIVPSHQPVGLTRSVLRNQLKAKLAAGSALVEFWVSAKHTYAWVVRRDRIAIHRLSIGHISLSSEVEDLLKLVTSPGKRVELQRTGGRLYDALIRPLEDDIGGVVSLYVVPDGPLHTLPFPALWNSQAGRYLGEEYSVCITPSAALLMFAPHAPPDGEPRILVFANPSFDERLFPKLPRLPGAEAEASVIAKNFPGAVIFRGNAATKAEFLKNAPHFDIIHFGGHAVVHPTDPRLSALLFAPDPSVGDATGILYAHELSSVLLNRAKVVVLAACTTAGQSSHLSDGPAGFASAFLARHANVVLANVAPTADASGVPYFTEFYDLIAEGQGSLAAFRNALTRQVKDGADPHLWATQVLYVANRVGKGGSL
jgi:CHAT domain-containing protein